MKLGTFGAVFETAIMIEGQLARRYTAQADAQSDPDTHALYRQLAAEGEKRLQRLERVRRETVTEMILEPITGLQLSDDLAALETSDAGAPLASETAHSLERSAAHFYEEAAARIGQAEAARALRRLAQENERRAARLLPAVQRGG